MNVIAAAALILFLGFGATEAPLVPKAWIACKKEKPTIYWSPEWNPAIDPCLWMHEREHLKDLRENRPDACTGKENGYKPQHLSIPEIHRSECSAYQVQYRCYLSRGHNDPRFREAVRLMYGCQTGDENWVIEEFRLPDESSK